ncbi:MAG: acetylxylan esterase [Atopobiaceae bacterium]|nr:acetylxylan esterase [Atopobiaceae bacterium]
MSADNATVQSEWRVTCECASRHASEVELHLTPVELGNPHALYQELSCEAVDGGQLRARVVVPATPGEHPVVLMFHDATRGVRGWHHMTRFVALGCAVVALQCRDDVRGVLVDEPLFVGDGLGIAMRAHGEEPVRLGRKIEARTSDALVRTYSDALVLAHVAGRIEGIDASRLFTWGEGLGGGIALLVASLVDASGACALNPLPAALDDSCAMLDVARIACGYACPVLMGTCLLDLQATPEAQDVLASCMSDVRRISYPRYGHERVNAFEDEMISFLMGLVDCPTVTPSEQH